MKIFGSIGLKNVGKTFLIQLLIKKFVSLDLKVASIKHAHHDFDIDYPGTDSYIHRESGSTQVIVSSAKRWVKINELDNKKEKTLDELISEISSVDLIVVEGFKKENHPKLEIIKDNSDPESFLFPKLKNIIGLISDKKIDTTMAQFKKNEISIIADFILKSL